MFNMLRYFGELPDEEGDGQENADLAWKLLDDVDLTQVETGCDVGKGSGGVVYKCLWKGQSVAVKALKSHNEYEVAGTTLDQVCACESLP